MLYKHNCGCDSLYFVSHEQVPGGDIDCHEKSGKSPQCTEDFHLFSDIVYIHSVELKEKREEEKEALASTGCVVSTSSGKLPESLPFVGLLSSGFGGVWTIDSAPLVHFLSFCLSLFLSVSL